MKIIDKNLSILEHEFSDEFENSQRNKYLVLNLRGKEYAIEISFIAEIIEAEKIVFVQNASAGTQLSIMYKDKPIPAVSLKNLFKLPETKFKDKIVIIINIDETQKALLVDSVMDIEDIDIDNSQKFAVTAGAIEGNYIKAAYRLNGIVKNILNIEKIFSF